MKIKVTNLELNLAGIETFFNPARAGPKVCLELNLAGIETDF